MVTDSVKQIFISHIVTKTYMLSTIVMVIKIIYTASDSKKKRRTKRRKEEDIVAAQSAPDLELSMHSESIHHKQDHAYMYNMLLVVLVLEQSSQNS